MNDLIEELYSELEDMNNLEDKFSLRIAYAHNSVKTLENKLSKLAFKLQETKPFYSSEIAKIKDSIFYLRSNKSMGLSEFKFGQILEIIRILKNNVDNNCITKKPKIFISHSVKDIAYIKAFVSMLEKMGVGQEHLFCSSISPYNIGLGENIYDYLRNEFENYDLYVIFMLSTNYYKSRACLNEMGAAWALKSEYQAILLPELNFKKVDGAIDPQKISFQLDNVDDRRSRLTDLKDKIINKLELPNLGENNWEKFKLEFTETVDGIKKQNIEDKNKKIKKA